MTATNATQQTVESLPVYRVTRTGLNKGQAARLAEAFGVSGRAIAPHDGVVSYLDPDRYLRVPMTDVSDADDAEMLRAMSAAARPNTRLHLQKNRL